MSDEYEDIIHLPHHVSRNHPQMPVRDRAAQFAPFAALTGYGDALRETARLTEEKVELGEFDQEERIGVCISFWRKTLKVCRLYLLHILYLI